ncbi:MAG: hAT transposon family protein [Candidatus Thiodiazotropha sp.]
MVENAGKKKAQCNLCHSEVSYSGGSTGTMANHLKHVHKSVNVEKASNQPTVQSKITDFKKTPPVSTMSRPKWQKITEKLAQMCARDLRPLSIVEGGGFKDFCNELNPSYDVPGKTTITNYLTLSYDQMKSDLVKSISSQPGVSLTTDHWTSVATEGYITVTGHFVDENWNFQNYVLATRKTTERHTGENIYADLQSVCREYAIKDENITCLVSDNASNMVSCAALLPDNITHVRCFGHTLQLAIRSSFDKVPMITRTISAAKGLVNHFKRSVNINIELERRQRQMGIATNKLIIDCPTRWNSTYNMFERLLEQRLAIYAVLHDQTITKPSDARVLDMADEQWSFMEAIVPVLQPLYMATRLMCSEEYPTLSGVYPVLFSLIDMHLALRDTDCPAVAAFKTHVSDDLKRRYKLNDPSTLCKGLAMMCTFLDPRYKALPFLPVEQRTAVHEHVRSLLTADTPSKLQTDTKTETETDNAEGTRGGNNNNFSCKRGKLSQDDVAFLLGGYFDMSDCEVVVPSSGTEELEFYTKEKSVNPKTNPFTWWKQNRSTYPKLATLARRVLCSPATSVPSERVFSIAGGTVSKLRGALDPDTVDKLVFLNKRFKSVLSSVGEKVSVKVEPQPSTAESSTVKVEPNLPALPSLPALPTLD